MRQLQKAALTKVVKKTALKAGADLVGIASIDRYDNAPPEVHPRGIFSKTESIVVVGCRMVRGALKTIEEGNYWQAYNCDSYWYMNEVVAPEILRAICITLEDNGCTAVPIHNPFAFGDGRSIRVGGTRPDGAMSLRIAGCAAGLGELGLSKLCLTPQFGPRQRLFAVLTDAVLTADPLVKPGTVCDNCGACIRGCPPAAYSRNRSVSVRIGKNVYTHSTLDCDKCIPIHQGWDPKFSPFLRPDSTREHLPNYYSFLDNRFRHRSICGGRGCVRACMDHLEKTGRITKLYRTPMIEGKQWVIEDPVELETTGKRKRGSKAKRKS
jgi:ferredoxin